MIRFGEKPYRQIQAQPFQMSHRAFLNPHFCQTEVPKWETHFLNTLLFFNSDKNNEKNPKVKARARSYQFAKNGQ